MASRHAQSGLGGGEDAETDSLDDAIDELGSEYSEEEIRLVRIKFISEVAN